MHVATAPRRHPSHGGYARGEEARARIIATALRIFGEYGYDQASTRQIAAAAGVNPPALQYYFDSKEGLHRACAQHIIDGTTASMAPAFARSAGAAIGNDTHEAMESLLALLDALSEGLAAAGSENWSRFIARGRADGGGPAIELIRERLGAPLFEAVTQLLCVVTGRAAPDDVVRLRALAILAQAYWFHAHRDNTLAVMGWPEFDAQRLSSIKAVVREHTRAILSSRGGDAA